MFFLSFSFFLKVDKGNSSNDYIFSDDGFNNDDENDKKYEIIMIINRYILIKTKW